MVPADILSRITALPPQRVLDAPIWQLLRDGGAELPARLREAVRANLGERAADPGPGLRRRARSAESAQGAAGLCAPGRGRRAPGRQRAASGAAA